MEDRRQLRLEPVRFVVSAERESERMWLDGDSGVTHGREELIVPDQLRLRSNDGGVEVIMAIAL